MPVPRVTLRRCAGAAFAILLAVPTPGAARKVASEAAFAQEAAGSPSDPRPDLPPPDMGLASPPPDAPGPRPGRGHRRGPSYASEEITVATSAGHVLAGTLTLPRRSGPSPGRRAAGEDAGHPAMVLVTGSGPDDRDLASAHMPGYQPFWQMADILTRRGIAVLRLDDRGVGSSTGAFDEATPEDFAEDVRAALAYLRSRPDIDPVRLGVLGHSEGGVVASMVAAEDPELAAVVLLASPATNLRSIVAYQLRYRLDRDPGIPFASRERELVATLKRWDVVADEHPRLKFSRTYDPLPAVKRIRAPVLILHGETDRQVPPRDAAKLAKALRESGNADVSLRLFPRVDHLLLMDRSGDPRRYRELSSRRIPGLILDEVGHWAALRLVEGGAPAAGAGSASILQQRGASITTIRAGELATGD